jgi:hypothetical protein
LCPIEAISKDKLMEAFHANPTIFGPMIPEIRTIPVPELAPVSAEQAKDWSDRFWPAQYKNTNPYGPHPTIVNRVEAELMGEWDFDSGATEKGVVKFMGIAKKAARETAEKGVGLPIGATVVERTAKHGARVVAVAGDARYLGMQLGDESSDTTTNASNSQTCAGFPGGHAVMRAIAHVANKRLMLNRHYKIPRKRVREDRSNEKSNETSGDAEVKEEGNEQPKEEEVEEVTPVSEIPPPANGRLSDAPFDPTLPKPGDFLAEPLTEREHKHYYQESLVAGGYLCLDLELYVTHEPCVMCTMAALHARFGRVIFMKEMPLTGALAAERPILRENPLGSPVLISPTSPNSPQGTFPSHSVNAGTGIDGAKLTSALSALRIANISDVSTVSSGSQASTNVSAGGLTYGLFWRPQLNWKFLCWLWVQQRVSPPSLPSWAEDDRTVDESIDDMDDEDVEDALAFLDIDDHLHA